MILVVIFQQLPIFLTIAEISIDICPIIIEFPPFTMVLPIGKHSLVNLFIIFIYWASNCLNTKPSFGVIFPEPLIAIILLFIFPISKFKVSHIISLIDSIVRGEMSDAFSMFLSIEEVSFVTVFVDTCHDTLTVPFTIAKLTLEKVSI